MNSLNNNKNRHKEILLETFVSFINFCNKYNLHYVAAYGTVIGALRHGGMIPWDDDIDVYMDRENYNRFLALRDELFDSEYEILDVSDFGYYLPFAKFCNKRTSLIEHTHYPIVLGVFIDVFPLDKVDNNLYDVVTKYNQVNKAFNNYTRSLVTLSCAQILSLIKKKDIRSIISRLYSIFKSKLFVSRQSLLNDYFRVLSNSMINDGSCYIDYAAMKPRLFPGNILTDTIFVTFEGIQIRVPRDYNGYLQIVYGNWMELPPIDKRVSHTQTYLNLDRRVAYDEIHDIIYNGSK